MSTMSLFSIARAKWDFLKSIHPLFLYSESLPSGDSAEAGRHGPIRDTPLERLKNDITVLRSDIKLNIITQNQVDFDELKDEASMRDLVDELDSILELFELLVDDSVRNCTDQAFGNPHCLTDYPKLLCLRSLLLSFGSNVSEPQGESITTSSHWNLSHEQDGQIAAHIHFPQDPQEINVCKRVITRFGKAVVRIFTETTGTWDMEAQTQYYTEAEVSIIQDARNFALACSSLFEAISLATACGKPHHARLDLSGFRHDEFRVHISSCEEGNWIPASFTRLFDEYKPDSYDFGYLCSCAKDLECLITSTPVHFRHVPVPSSQCNNETCSPHIIDATILDGFIGQRRLKKMHRRLLAVLLACSLLQLYDSPWIQHRWERDTLYIPSCPRNIDQLQQWCPHVLCSLSTRSAMKLHSDDIAAFGVLLMELEVDYVAPWTEEDIEWPSDERSNRVRLARILKEWDDDINEDYRQIGRSCLDFESLVDTLDHGQLGPDMKHLAIIFKCILDPLLRCLVKDFGKTAKLFQGIPGPWSSLSGTVSITTSSVAKRSLFDDLDTTASDERVGLAIRFLDNLESHLNSILRLGMANLGLASLRTGPTKGKIRVVILDSGIDETDPTIRGALASLRIKKRKNFVGESTSCEDTYGHGTHVTKLLLRTARAAEIYVAKICNSKLINQDFMEGIAKAIRWASEECDADIISLSLGFEDEYDAIDSAIDDAVHNNKLVFAAASNNGGISGRSRPARNENVMCIHASDGQGNKGSMNPGPLPNASNFTTLGVAVPLKWKGREVWKSGTSFATPIAAAFAANVLEFANRNCSLPARRRTVLRSRRGMEAIFRYMSTPRDGYDFVHPGRLWGNNMTDQEVASRIEGIIRAI